MTLPEKFHFLEVKNATPIVLKIKNKIIQRKLDGTAVEIFIGYDDLGDIRLFGRGVLQFGIASDYSKRFPEIIEILKKLKLPKKTDFVGELIVIDKKTGFEDLRLILIRSQRDVARNGDVKLYPAQLIILDVAMVGGKDVRSLKYLDRIETLKNSIEDWSIATDIISFIKNSNQLDWNFIEKNKLEGVVVRDADAAYNKSIWKIKLVQTEDVYCKGEYNPSETMTMEGKELFASLICYQLKDNEEIYVADVGGGFTEEQRKDIQNMLNSGKINKDNPLVLEIKTFGRVDSSLKFKSPNFLRIRYDKPWRQCIMT